MNSAKPPATFTSQRAGRNRTGAVYRDHHRERSGPVPGVDRHARNACEEPCLNHKSVLPPNFAERTSSGQCTGGGLNLPGDRRCCRGPCLLSLCRWSRSSVPGLQGHWFDQLGFPDPDSETAGRSRRRHGQRHRRIGVHSADCQSASACRSASAREFISPSMDAELASAT